MRRRTVGAAAVVVALGAAAFTAHPSRPKQAPERGPLTLTSSAFPDHGLIPINYSCAGANTSPPLAWHGVAPPGTAQWALVVEDISVKPSPWIHWIVTGIGPHVRSAVTGHVPDGGVSDPAGNDTRGFVGLCPPIGKVHEYRFTVFALNKALTVTPQTRPVNALSQVTSATISSVSLTGRFGR